MSGDARGRSIVERALDLPERLVDRLATGDTRTALVALIRFGKQLARTRALKRSTRPTRER